MKRAHKEQNACLYETNNVIFTGFLIQACFRFLIIEMVRIKTKFIIFLFSLLVCHFNSVGQSFQKEVDGIIINGSNNANGINKTKIVIWANNIIQVRSTAGNEFSNRESFIVTGKNENSAIWDTEETATQISVRTGSLIAIINKSTLNVTFYNAQNHLLLAEESKESLETKVVNEDCYHIKQTFKYSEGEKLYGLGNFQNLDLTLNDRKVVLLQKNKEDAVPMLVSTNHYGILWDNYSYSEFNDIRGSFYLWSEVADEINYYFIYGEQMDSIISSYRMLTGKAPMYPKWAFGYIQSKQKYNTQDEVVSVVKGFRERNFPMDLIIQDWQYWPTGQWGQKSFNYENYPNPKQMVKDIHSMNSKIIISIWPNAAKGSPNQLELAGINGLLKNEELLNVHLPEARQMYWKQVNDSLFSIGIDGWWTDCTEGYDSDWTSHLFNKPSETKYNQVNLNVLKDLMGSGRYVNLYPLLHAKGIYEGQRSTSSPKRVFIHSRSVFAGIQKYGASYWTGDVSSNWEEFRMQIPAGLSFCLTGLPYWTSDIGGYFIKNKTKWWFSSGTFEKGQEDEGFKELYTRWFQFASFCPLFRAHGADFPREPWTFGTPDSKTHQTLLKFTNLRYRLIPYIYSMAWKVTNDNYTLMRALTFDFIDDSVTYAISDQYMFGSSFLVNPVVEPLYYLPNNLKMNTSDYSRTVYLPKNTQWFDFWTGAVFSGGQTIKADASFETMPLFVKAGSIIPFGPSIQYSTEKSDPIEIRIYPGANGEFVLYEDENDNYNYEKGAYTLIAFKWNDNKKSLTIEDRKGNFSGMLKERNFNIILVDTEKGTGLNTEGGYDKSVKYKGKITEVKF